MKKLERERVTKNRRERLFFPSTRLKRRRGGISKSDSLSLVLYHTTRLAIGVKGEAGWILKGVKKMCANKIKLFIEDALLPNYTLLVFGTNAFAKFGISGWVLKEKKMGNEKKNENEKFFVGADLFAIGSVWNAFLALIFCGLLFGSICFQRVFTRSPPVLLGSFTGFGTADFSCWASTF